MQSIEDFFAAASVATVEAEGKVPRDRYDRPMIQAAPGDEHLAYKSGKHQGLVPYARASSYGSKADDRRNLELWQIRQAVRGMGILLEQGKVARGPHGGMPRDPLIEPDTSDDKSAWNDFAEQCQLVAGSKIKADLGTAIHYGTELVDRGGSLTELPDLVLERATAYWKFCIETGIKMVDVEVFGVEDIHHVAGTWDRTGTMFGRYSVVDCKTSSSLDFSGLTFAVQLAVYAHAKAYDPATGRRTPHRGDIDLDTAWIVHIDRNEGGPVTLHRVDIARGWRWCALVDEIIATRKDARTAIGSALTANETMILRAVDRPTLETINKAYGAGWTAQETTLANQRWKELAP